MRGNDNGVGHDHAFRTLRVDPHHDEDVEELVQRKEEAYLTQRVHAVRDPHLQEVGEDQRQRHEQCREAERDQVLRFDLQSRQMQDADACPYEHRRHNERHALLLRDRAVYSHLIQ